MFDRRSYHGNVVLALSISHDTQCTLKCHEAELETGLLDGVWFHDPPLAIQQNPPCSQAAVKVSDLVAKEIMEEQPRYP